MNQSNKLPWYYICDAFTDKGNFINCIYKYVSYNERYVMPKGSSEYIRVEKEGCFHVTYPLTERLVELIISVKE